MQLTLRNRFRIISDDSRFKTRVGQASLIDYQNWLREQADRLRVPIVEGELADVANVRLPGAETDKTLREVATDDRPDVNTSEEVLGI